MTEKNEIVNEEGNQVPEWLTTGAEGMEEVSDDFRPDELAVATSMTGEFTEGKVDLKHVFNRTTGEDLGPERNLVLVRYKIRFQCFNEDGDALICKSYDRETGMVRAYQDEKFDQEFIEEMKLTEEELGSDSLVERKCDDCPLHPANWRSDGEGNNIPPRCEESHEFVVLDITEGFNKAPFLVRVPKNSRLKKNFIKGLNNLIRTKLRLQNIPLWGAVFKMYGEQVENSRGGKNVVWGADFNGYVKNKELFDYCKKLYKDLENSEEERTKKAEQNEMAAKTTTEPENIEVAGEESAWDDDGDETWPE